jgi:hypothetical protein
MVCGALFSEWSDERIKRYYDDIYTTTYPSDKVAKVMAVYAPVKAEQVALFHQPPVTNYEYA